MKVTHYLLTATMLFIGLIPLSAHETHGAEDYDVVKLDTMSRPFRPGQVLVKFKDDSSINLKKQGSGRVRASSSRVQAKINQLGITNIEQLMPVAGKIKVKNSSRVRYANGKQIEDRDLSKLYLVEYDAEHAADVREVVKEFQQLDEVEFAEPNYVVYALGSPAPAPAIQQGRRTATPPPTFTPNDPMYSQQWGPGVVRLPEFWTVNDKNVLGRRPVVAILDTGVDLDHPDLKDNIWINEKEANGADGADDDMNGYVDDLHGWDCVNQTGRIGDWNGHGTHCAGIAAAVANNGIGIVGANPDAQIMAVTVLQSDGIGDVGTIIRGLEYCLTHDVDVISMSLGSYGYSKAEEMALGKCYHNSVIVAAAGNDGLCIYPGHSCCSKPMYPGAFTFVLGVEASKDYAGTCYSSCGYGEAPYKANPWRACFSNLDDDNPIYTDLNIFDEEKLYNYELLVPGTNIISTYPGGRYKVMNGTSMATPLAAGAISRLLQMKEYSSKELLFGDLIASANADSKVMDIMAAYNITDADRKPTLWFVSYEMSDVEGGDGDGRFDAGEVIELYPILRNSWGEAVGIKCSLSTSDNEDPEIIELIDNDIDFGRTLNSYGKEKSVNPIRFKINENCVDGRHIRLTLSSNCENGTGETIHQDIVIVAESGEELGGILDKNKTLEAGKHYIVNKSIAIPNGITLTIEPGVTLKLHDGAIIKVDERGRIKAIGTADKPIIITKGDLSQGQIPTLALNNYCQFEFCQFLMLSAASSNLITGGRFTDCLFKDCVMGRGLPPTGMTGVTTTRCNIVDCTGDYGYEFGNTHKNTNIIGNIATALNKYVPASNTQWTDVNNSNVYGNYNNYLHTYANIHCTDPDLKPKVVYSDNPSYLGTTREDIARKTVIDYYHEVNDDNLYTTFASVDISNLLKQPSSEAHGIVWKILVNGKDAQDEYDEIPPLGVGTHKVEVYFNRPMDKTIQPYLAMGVRPPYTQNFINEEPSWNEEGTIYTAYITITAKSAFDGVNRFYVADAQDLQHFVIPTENSRFNVPVGAAGSKSTGFMAEPGVGYVKLTWESVDPEEVEDVMGYNMYRYTLNDDGVASDTILVNEEIIESKDNEVIEEMAFTDYNVTPGTTYYYYYRALRSTLDSSEPSMNVAATPLSSSQGDANGDLNVTVNDVVTIIDYLTNQKPKPFIFEAADINGDGVLNILDVVATINIILGYSASHEMIQSIPTATLTVENGILYLDSPVALGGVQLSLNAPEEVCFVPQKALENREFVNYKDNEGLTDQLMTFSVAGQVIPAGRQAIVYIGDASLVDVVLSDQWGRPVNVEYNTVTGIVNVNDKVSDRSREIYDLNGRRVTKPSKGLYIINGKKVVY